MGKLQQTAEAATVLNQRKKKKKKSKKQSAEGKREMHRFLQFLSFEATYPSTAVTFCSQTTDELLATKARPPPDGEFVDIFQKFKYCFSLLVRIPSSPEHYLLTRGSCIFIASVYFSGSPEINHHQSFFRGPHSPCVQASGYGESGL